VIHQFEKTILQFRIAGSGRVFRRFLQGHEKLIEWIQSYSFIWQNRHQSRSWIEKIVQRQKYSKNDGSQQIHPLEHDGGHPPSGELRIITSTNLKFQKQSQTAIGETNKTSPKAKKSSTIRIHSPDMQLFPN